MAGQAGPVQAGAMVISVAGILWTAIAAVQAANPMPQIVLTLVAVAVLIGTVLRAGRG
jgi:hypothetical protein